MKPPFFIVGTQRSGTTLLGHMLNTHPDLYVLNEFWDLYSHIGPQTEADEQLVEVLMSRLELEESYLPEVEPFPSNPFDHIELAFGRKAESLEKKRWGLKHPRLTYFLEEFHRGLPGAQYVFIVRDPRAVSYSYLTRKWNVANVYQGALLWQGEIETQMEFVRHHPDNTHVLKYEELVLEPEGALRALCAFLGEEYVDELLKYYLKTPEIRLHQGNINITRPLQPAIIDKWRQELSRWQVGVIETLTAETMSELGYARAGEEVELRDIHRHFYSWHQKILTTYWWQKRSKLRGIRDRLRRLVSRG